MLQAVLDEVVEHVGYWGWDSAAWTDDSLASKKVYPGYQFPAKVKSWLPRVKVCAESMELFVRRVHDSHAQLPEYMRKFKKDQAAMDQLAERAAFIWNVGQEFLQQVPVKPGDLQTGFYDLWAFGSSSVDTDAQAALMDKSASFDVTKSMSSLRALMEAHLFTSPVPQSLADKDSLDVDAWELQEKQLCYDLNVFETYKKKCAAAETAREAAKQEWRLRRREKCEQATTQFVDTCCKLVVWDGKKAELTVAEAAKFKREMLQKCGAAGQPDRLPALVFLNYTSPCLIYAEHFAAHQHVLTWAMHESGHGVGLLLAPVFTYNKGRIHLEEQKLLTMFGNAHLNMDTHFSLLYQEKADTRDCRPMTYPGRLVFPGATDISKSLWQGCLLRKLQRTAPQEFVKSKDLREIENLSADSLPPSTDLRDNHVHGASKVCQVGPEACAALLQSMLEGADTSKLTGLLLLDLFPHTADMLEAFCLQQRVHAKNLTLSYMGFFESQTHLTWAETFVKEILVGKIEEGSLNMPNGDRLDKEISEDLLESLPRKPDLNVLVWTKEGNLAIPAGLVKKWQGHALVGDKFAHLLSSFSEKGVTVADDSAATGSTEQGQNPSPNKRGGADNQDSAAKRLKLDFLDLSQRLLEANAVSEPLLFEAVLGGKAAPTLQLRSNHLVVLYNKTETTYTSSAAPFLAGFGKGSFKLVKPGEDTKGHKFEMKSSEDLVVLNGSVQTLGKVVCDMRDKKPDCQVCYHNLTPDTEDAKKFSLQTTHCVAFLPKGLEEKDKVDQNNLAVKEGWATWQDSAAVQVLWAVRWVTKGLTPVKPVVHLRQAVSLNPGAMCRLSK